MATIAEITNIVNKAKAGQYVSIRVGDNDTYVVSLNATKFGAIKAENWTEGWEPGGSSSEEPTPEPTPTIGGKWTFTSSSGATLFAILADNATAQSWSGSDSDGNYFELRYVTSADQFGALFDLGVISFSGEGWYMLIDDGDTRGIKITGPNTMTEINGSEYNPAWGTISHS